MENTSEKYSLNSADLKKIGIGLGVAVSGAVLTYFTELIPSVDFGAWTPVVVAGFSVVVNVVRKFLTNYTTQ